MTDDLNPPADLSLYNLRRDLIARRNAAPAGSVEREQLAIMVEMVNELDQPGIEPERRAGLLKFMWRQAELIRRTSASQGEQ